MKCKDCEYLKIEIPDKLNEGHAYCLKHNLSTMLIGSHYKTKIDRLECFEEELKEINKCIE